MHLVHTGSSVHRICLILSWPQRTFRSGSYLDLPTPIAMNRSPPDSSSANHAFYTPDPKLGTSCLPSFSTYRTTVCSDASWRHFCLNVHSLHSDSLATGHWGVSDGQIAFAFLHLFHKLNMYFLMVDSFSISCLVICPRWRQCLSTDCSAELCVKYVDCDVNCCIQVKRGTRWSWSSSWETSASGSQRIWLRRACVRPRSRTLFSLTWPHIRWVIPPSSNASSLDCKTPFFRAGLTTHSASIVAFLLCFSSHIRPTSWNRRSRHSQTTTTRLRWNASANCSISIQIKRVWKIPVMRFFGRSLLLSKSDFRSAKYCCITVICRRWELNGFLSVVFCVHVTSNWFLTFLD